MSWLRIFSASIGVSPCPSISEHSASDAAMADVHPNVRYFASVITSFSGFGVLVFTRKVNFSASPHTIEPCWPSPSGVSSISPRCVPGLALHRIHENLFRLFAVLPSHENSFFQSMQDTLPGA
jgi:hypothetical protein